MFLEYGGVPISRQWKIMDQMDQSSALGQVESCMKAIHRLGVLHRDVMPRNILRNCESGKVMVIDFERAKMDPARPVLGMLSSNRKRKASIDDDGQKLTGRTKRLFEQEMAEVREEISCL
jgi:serine/threonine protein kinase